MIFLHPGLGYKDFFFIILYLRFNLRSSAIASSYEHLSMGMVLRIPSLFYFTIMVSPFMSKCTLPVLILPDIEGEWNLLALAVGIEYFK